MPQTVESPRALADDVVEAHRYDESALIGILQDIQAKINWLPETALRRVAEVLSIPLARVYGIASFYKAFSLKPRGKHLVQCCTGTACHVRGGPRVRASLETHLGIGEGETTPDMLYTLEMVRCLGCCSLAPVVMVGDEFHGQLNQASVVKTLKEYD